MNQRPPVFILGAPRSGTSLLQKILREQPGFCSVPKESQMIWGRYCHPQDRAWLAEGIDEQDITPELCETIRLQLAGSAISAERWKKLDRFRIMEGSLSARIARKLYPFLHRPLEILNRSRNARRTGQDSRLLEKSVHAGLWLNLVLSVFPDSKLIHIVRSPSSCIPSMMRGWREPERFRTYRLPEPLRVPGLEQPQWWRFPLPAGWQSVTDRPLHEVCTFQWLAIQRSILQYQSERIAPERSRRLHLEELTQNPRRELQRLCAFIDMDWNPDLERVSDELPVVNASAGAATPCSSEARAYIERQTETVARQLGSR